VRTANDDANVVYFTLRADGDLDERRRAAIDDVVARARGSAFWRVSSAMRRAYGLVELPDASCGDEIRGAWHGIAYDGPIIAVAVFPAAPQALPAVLESVGGRGRPAGIVSAEPCDGAAIVEWNAETTAPQIVMALVDVELRRFASARTAELLTPLPPGLAAMVAAAGLAAPEVTAGKVLELRVEGA
jgi:hypothetical protein